MNQDYSNTLNRRQLCAAAIALGAMPASVRSATALGRSSSPIVDTHLHCFAGSRDARFPYHQRAPYQPDKAATPEMLLRLMKQAGVDHAVVVHPEPYQDDHRYLEHCLSRDSARLRGTCLFFADRPGSIQKLPGLVNRNPGLIVAARVHAYAPDRLPPFGTAELKNLWKTASDLGLMMQLHFEPRYAEGFEPYIREFPQTKVIIDHMGRPFQGTPQEHAVVIRWANLPNTIMKISSLPPRDKYPHRDVAPIVKELAAAYSADRLIYGGGFNSAASGRSYRDYRQRVASLLPFLSAADLAKVLGGNAARLYGFEKVRG